MPVRRDSRGRWRYQKVVQLFDGTTVRIGGTPTLNTRVAAEEAEREHIHRVLHPPPETPQKKEVPTFDVFADEFMKTYAKANNKPSEQESKRSILKHHLRPAFGRLHLDAITAREVETLKAKLLGNELSAKRVNNILIVLSKILKYAEEIGVVEAIPRIKSLKLPPSKFDFLDDSEYERLRDAARREPEWLAAILTAGDAGLRMGEIVALEWGHVDLKARRVTVRQADWHGVVGTPKGGRARDLPLTDRLTAALIRHRHLRGARIFCGPGGESWTRTVMKLGLGRVCKRAGLRTIGWHALRHTFCSHLAMRGAPAKAIQELAGHSTLAMTMRYMHLNDSTLRSAIALLDAAGVQT